MYFPANVPRERLLGVLSIPGVIQSNGGVRCTWDIAWAVARLLGQPEPQVPMFDGPLPGLARYRHLGLHTKTRPYQKEDILFLARRAWAILAEPMRCLSGSTELVINRAGVARRFALRDIVHRFAGGAIRGGKGSVRYWRPDIDTYTQSVDEEGFVRLNRIAAVHSVGLKPAFLLRTQAGHQIIASADHRIATPVPLVSGYATLSDLRKGDPIFATTVPVRQPPFGPRANPYRVVGRMQHHPFARHYEYFRRGRTEHAHHVLRHRLAAEAKLNGHDFEVFVERVRVGDIEGLRFLDPAVHHVHHRDGDPANDDPDNLEVLSSADHSRTHSVEGGWKRVMARQEVVRIESIEEVEPEPMFDLTMEDPLNNYVASGLVVHNSGKCLMTIGADVLVDSRRTLIVCPAIAKHVWADEIQLWTGEAALLLSGRGGREARLRCLTCSGIGEVPSGDLRLPCPDCKARNGVSYGYKLYDVPELQPVTFRDTQTGDISWGEVGKVACPKHPEVSTKKVRAREKLYCVKCQNELLLAIQNARYVIVNYELLVRQHVDLGGGRTMVREDLKGWVDTLKPFAFDVLVADEAHMLRGWSTTRKREGEGRNARLHELAERVQRVWMVTGTPFFGFTKDVFWLLEIASGGLFGGGGRGLRGRKFMERYCEGHKGQYGYEAKGRSIFAETELMRRLEGTTDPSGVRRFDGIWVKRPRSELFKDQPPTPRRLVRLELEGVRPFIAGQGKRKDQIVRAIRQNSDLKREAIFDSLMNELAEGNRIFVLHFHKPSAKKTFAAFEQAISGSRSPYRARMREVGASAWLATGAERTGDDEGEGNIVLTDEQKANWADSADERYRLAKLFREHPGAGVIVATIDAMQVAVSLKGASGVHVVDLHYSPGAIAQAEERPWYPGCVDLSITYYSAKGSVDDHLEAEVVPKIETLVRMAREKSAEEMLAAFGNQDEEERTFDRIWARLTQHVREARLDAEAFAG